MIKDFRFNPALHEYVNNGGAIDLTTVVAAAEKATPVEVAKPELVVQAQEVEPKIAEENLDNKKFSELKTIAKERGLVISPSTKKAELLKILKNG